MIIFNFQHKKNLILNNIKMIFSILKYQKQNFQNKIDHRKNNSKKFEKNFYGFKVSKRQTK